MSSEASFGGGSERDPLADVPTECYDVLRHPRRLRLLEVLGTYRTRLTLEELTTELVERESLEVSTGQARHDVRVSLVHNHLPRLAEYDILEWDAETGAELVDEPPVHPADLAGLLALCDGDRGQELLDALVHPVRMPVVSVLSDHKRPLSVEQLASELVAHGVDIDPEQARVSLYHSHLPTLADIGVLEFDHDSGLVVRHEQELSTIQ
ncbi:DUF7344 domain-containing protein [Natronorubrum sp. DTA28]|uniref:DUF7344 domain-containing protein n=1 Tax=Natronorubrum sp. DTA28 TaxID=3447019 RepID=UPI003F84BFA2